jgi:hypothetical protein
MSQLVGAVLHKEEVPIATVSSIERTIDQVVLSLQWNDSKKMWMAFVESEGLECATGILDHDPTNAARRGIDEFFKRNYCQRLQRARQNTEHDQES